jgi:hypothetical protein
MASISLIYTTPKLNPTTGFLPYNNGTVNFADSVLYNIPGRLSSFYGSTQKGLSLDFTSNLYTLGDSNYLQVGSGATGIALTVAGIGITAPTAGSAAGQPHLIVNVNGTLYKIQLLAFS